METSRQQVFEYIRSQQTVTAADLSRALGMTPANARHHLKILQNLELVIATTCRKQAGKGRPARVYRLSEKIIGDNTGLLAEILLNVLIDQTSPEALPASIGNIAHLLAQAHGHDNPANVVSQAARLFQAVQRLNQMQYQARWEARSNAPRLVIYNCPYLLFAEKMPVICEVDAALIQELVGLAAYQKERLFQDARGRKYCVFQLGSVQTNI